MFRKVLKYDMNAVIKLWSVLTASVLVFSILGGLSVRGLMTMSNEVASIAFSPLYILGILLFIISIAAYGLATVALVIIRFYKNFFTDEAYLTFTLPVKRSTLFNSKLLTAFIFNTATGIITFIGLVVFLAIAPYELGGASLLTVIVDSFRLSFQSFAAIMTDQLAAWLITYGIVLVIYILVAFMFETLLLFCTVTFGSLLAKKHKILLSILVYYGVNVVMTIVGYIVEIALSIGINLLVIVPEVLAGTEILWLLLGGFIFAICAMALIAAFFYKFALSKLRGNLNLA